MNSMSQPNEPSAQRVVQGSPEASPAGTAMPQAGWYDDPSVPGQQRYWDGAQWTANVFNPASPYSAATGTAQPQPVGSGVIIAGWVGAVLFPIVGLVIGILIMSRQKGSGTGLAMTTVSVVMGLLWLLISAGSSSALAIGVVP